VGIAASSMTGQPETVLRLVKKLKPDYIEIKTCSSCYREAHSVPRTAYIHTLLNQQLRWSDIQGFVYTTFPDEDDNNIKISSPVYTNQIAFANSVCIPSTSLPQTMHMIKEIQSKLKKEKLPTNLIFSVYGSSVKDFEYMAKIGNTLKVPYVCANLSCPNIENKGEPLYKNSELVASIIRGMKQLSNALLIVKIGIFKPDEFESGLMETILCKISDNWAYGVYGINAIPMRVVNADGCPTFGLKRAICGVSGAPIRDLALDFTRWAKSIIKKHNLPLKLFACGGVMDSADVSLFSQAGADVVMSATAAAYNPHFSFTIDNSSKKIMSKL